MCIRDRSHLYLYLRWDDTAQHLVQHPHSGVPESDGSFRIQPLVEAEGAGGPLPVAAAFTLQDDFLAQCVGCLLYTSLGTGFFHFDRERDRCRPFLDFRF